MKNKLAIALLIGGVLSIGAWSSYGQTGKEKNVTYEYAMIEVQVGLAHEEQVTMLNKFGAQGWEIVSVYQPANANPRIYFKRTIK